VTSEPDRTSDPQLAEIARLNYLFGDYRLPGSALVDFLFQDDDNQISVMSTADRAEALNLRESIRRRTRDLLADEDPTSPKAMADTFAMRDELRRPQAGTDGWDGTETAPKVTVSCKCCGRPFPLLHPSDSRAATRGAMCRDCHMEAELGTACPAADPPPDGTQVTAD
jgi:hypothetical protein